MTDYNTDHAARPSARKMVEDLESARRLDRPTFEDQLASMSSGQRASRLKSLIDARPKSWAEVRIGREICHRGTIGFNVTVNDQYFDEYEYTVLFLEDEAETEESCSRFESNYSVPIHVLKELANLVEMSAINGAEPVEVTCE